MEDMVEKYRKENPGERRKEDGEEEGRKINFGGLPGGREAEFVRRNSLQSITV